MNYMKKEQNSQNCQNQGWLAILLLLLLFAPWVRAQSLVGSNPVLPQIHARTLAWADYDSDGDRDLLMSGNNGAGDFFHGRDSYRLVNRKN